MTLKYWTSDLTCFSICMRVLRTIFVALNWFVVFQSDCEFQKLVILLSILSFLGLLSYWLVYLCFYMIEWCYIFTVTVFQLSFIPHTYHRVGWAFCLLIIFLYLLIFSCFNYFDQVFIYRFHWDFHEDSSHSNRSLLLRPIYKLYARSSSKLLSNIFTSQSTTKCQKTGVPGKKEVQ